MKTWKRAGLIALTAVTLVFLSELGTDRGAPLLSALVSPAQAKVGRPLTPVSVAGTARRTTRRCAAGVYDC